MNRIVLSVISFFTFINFANAQQGFTVHVLPSTITAAPAIHSGAFAEWNNKWIFIGGRIDGLHIMQANQAFPTYGRNDSVYVVDPVANTSVAAYVFQLPSYMAEALTSSNMQSYQNGQYLYMIGGYGKSDSLATHTTFPSLISIDLDCLVNAVQSSSAINSCFRQVVDTNLAVSGGELEKIDSTYYLVFGHRFEGSYAINQTILPFYQAYTNSIRKFSINDDGVNLSISNYTTITDTNNFHRRDYNLVPQYFPNREFGITAFGGVFQKNIDRPYLTPIDITSTNVTHQSAFNQNLEQYTTANLPVYDSLNNFMHTVFFGGMSLFTLDTTSMSLVQDTLVPFIKAITRVERDAAGNLTEYQMPEQMPGFLGSNSFFIADHSASYYDAGIVNLNNLSGNTRVGYIVGGIRSDAENIASLDPSGMSRPNATVYEVYVDKTIDNVQDLAVRNDINNLLVYPNPVSNTMYLDFTLLNSGKCDVSLYSLQGALVRKLYSENRDKGDVHLKMHTSGISKGVYFCMIKSEKSVKLVKVIINSGE